MASKSKLLGDLLDANGDVLLTNLDNVSVTPTAVSDQDNTSTGQFTLPSGTTAQRPVTSYEGAQRYNTDLGSMEYYDGTGWFKISANSVVIDSVTGNIYAGIVGSDLTLTGTGFLTDDITVNFSQSSDGIDEDVVVTASSDTSATVTVPANVYNNVTAGNVVSITVTNADASLSNAVTKTAIDIPSGGTITTSGNYRIHDFTSSGDFVVPAGFSATADYILVAGGAGGGGPNQQSALGGGGGGAGGLLNGSTSISAQTYSIVIGAGGAGDPKDSVGRAESGSNSTAFSLTAIGGGGGGTRNGIESGGDGGSGGGACGTDSAAGGAGTSGQGNRGGNTTGEFGAGGGGGKGGQGPDVPSSSNENTGGGAGFISSITGTSTVYAGGGGGGGNSQDNAGGTGNLSGGDGGDYESDVTGGDAPANRGGGGGGCAAQLNNSVTVTRGGNGASGRFIVRYDTTAV